MCGIFACIVKKSVTHPDFNSNEFDNLRHRGPDNFHHTSYSFGEDHILHMAGWTLNLRASVPTKMPTDSGLI